MHVVFDNDVFERFAEQLPKCLKRSRRLSRDRQRTARLHRPSKFA